MTDGSGFNHMEYENNKADRLGKFIVRMAAFCLGNPFDEPCDL